MIAIISAVSVVAKTSPNMDQEYHEDRLWDEYEYEHTPIINRIYVMADVQDLVCIYAHARLYRYSL